MRYYIGLSTSALLMALTSGCATTSSPSSSAKTVGLDKASKEAQVKYAQGLQARSLQEFAARGACRETLPQKPVKWQQAVSAASICVHKGRWQAVEKWGDWLAESEPRAPWGPYFLSLAAEARGDLARSLWMIDLALKKAPQSGMMVFQKGRLMWLEGERSSALKLFEEAARLDSGLVEAVMMLAQDAYDQRDWSKSEKHYRQALAQEPRRLGALLGLGQALVQKKQWDGAVDTLTSAVLYYPKSIEARRLQAQALERNESRLGDALVAYKRLLELGRDKRLAKTEMDEITAKIKQIEGRVSQTTNDKVSLRSTEEK